MFNDMQDTYDLMVEKPIFSFISMLISFLISSGFFILNTHFTLETLQENLILSILIIFLLTLILPLGVIYFLFYLYYILRYSHKLLLDKKQSTLLLKEGSELRSVQLHKDVYFIFSTREYHLNLKLIRGRRCHGNKTIKVLYSERLDLAPASMTRDFQSYTAHSYGCKFTLKPRLLEVEIVLNLLVTSSSNIMEEIEISSDNKLIGKFSFKIQGF